VKAELIIANYPGGQYPIYIGTGLLDSAELFQQALPGTQVMVVTNETIAPLYLDKITRHFSRVSHIQCDQTILPDGEAYKTLQVWQAILDQLIRHHHHRDTTLIALGGGVIGDMTGFAAACFQRGVGFIQVPTTLLSQVDASIGGKTAINHPLGKNLIGAFYQPQAVVIDCDTLKSLPDREFRSGIAEIIKAALIRDASFFSELEQQLPKLLARDPDVLIRTITRACRIKCDIVAADEKEHDVRALLNLGHTFGHALEQNLGYVTWLHGEAVSVGMLMAAELSKRLGWIDGESLTRIHDILIQAGLPVRLPSSIECAKLLAAMKVDKKVLRDRLRLVLLTGIGHAVVTEEVDDTELVSLIDYFIG